MLVTSVCSVRPTPRGLRIVIRRQLVDAIGHHDTDNVLSFYRATGLKSHDAGSVVVVVVVVVVTFSGRLPAI